jgi:hypothetical protein
MDLLHAYDSPSMFGSAADWEVELHTTAMATTTTLDSPAIDLDAKSPTSHRAYLTRHSTSQAQHKWQTSSES